MLMIWIMMLGLIPPTLGTSNVALQQSKPSREADFPATVPTLDQKTENDDEEMTDQQYSGAGEGLPKETGKGSEIHNRWGTVCSLAVGVLVQAMTTVFCVALGIWTIKAFGH
ncbi:hypothetical protein FKM82_013120 [Ascaphus truei]